MQLFDTGVEALLKTMFGLVNPYPALVIQSHGRYGNEYLDMWEYAGKYGYRKVARPVASIVSFQKASWIPPIYVKVTKVRTRADHHTGCPTSLDILLLMLVSQLSLVQLSFA
jgi:hypothetical protein